MNANQDFLISKIKDGLKANNIQINNKTIINSACEIIVELINRNRNELLPFYEIVVKFCDNETEITDLLKKVISYGLVKTEYKGISLGLIKKLYCKALIKLLLKHLDSMAICNILMKNDFDDFQINLDQKILILKNCSSEFLNINVIDFARDNNLQGDLNLLFLKYLQIIKEKSKNLNKNDLEFIIKSIQIENDNLKLLILIFYFNKKNSFKGGYECISLTGKIQDLVRYELIDREYTEEVVELISSMSNLLVPSFLRLIKDINIKYLQDQHKYSTVLRNIATYMKMEDFLEIIQPINMKYHFKVLKGVSNVDISIFLDLYHSCAKMDNNIEYSGNYEFEKIYHGSAKMDNNIEYNGNYEFEKIEDKQIPYLLNCIPSFCNYCTDFQGNIGQFLGLLAHYLPSSFVFSGLEKLIHSHLQNINSSLKLGVPIPVEQSQTILSAVVNSKIIYNVLDSFIKSQDFNIDYLIGLLIKIDDIDIGEALSQFIMNPNQELTLFDPSYKIRLLDALRLLIFFTLKKDFNYDFISRLLQLCNDEIPIQKCAYRLLNSIYENGNTNICICELIFSLQANTKLPSIRNRLRLEYTILKKGCSHHIKPEVYERFYQEMMTNFKDGNGKCKTFIKSVLMDLKDNDQFINFLISYTSSANKDDKLLYGCVEACVFLLEANLSLAESLFEICYYSQEVVRDVLNGFSLLIRDEYIDRIFRVVDAYIEKFGKKFNKELKQFCIKLINKKIALSPKMKTLMSFRNKSGKSKEYEIIKKKDFKDLY